MPSTVLTDERVTEIFRGLVFGVQKMRSISRESSGLSDAMLATTRFVCDAQEKD